MRNTRKWNKMAAIAMVSALILAAVGCGNTQTGAASQEDVENAAQEASLIEEAIEEEESAAAEDTSFENAEETAVEIPPADISNVKIDYKTSEIYSKEDMDKAIEKISSEGFDPVYGARPLKRAIQSKIEDKLSEQILDGKIKDNSNIVCDFEQDEFVFITK